MASPWMLRRVALVGADVSEELSTSIIRVERIGELGTLAVTSNRRTLQRIYCHPDDGEAKGRRFGGTTFFIDVSCSIQAPADLCLENQPIHTGSGNSMEVVRWELLLY
jgi:hypothetical protein